MMKMELHLTQSLEQQRQCRVCSQEREDKPAIAHIKAATEHANPTVTCPGCGRDVIPDGDFNRRAAIWNSGRNQWRRMKAEGRKP